MALKVRKAKRGKAYPKIALIAPSGGGKTYSALRLATGMAEEIKNETGKDAKILMVNTEAARGIYYADEFDYDIVDLEPPYNPEVFVDAIDFAVSEGYDVLIIDSTSPEWDGPGGCLELQQKAGGTYQAWGKVTPRHERFINAMSSSPIVLIATMRGKDQYEVEKDDRGKTSVKKIGAGAKQRDGFEYEFTCTFMIDQKTSTAEAQKDNTHIFENDPPQKLTEAHGRKIIKWANITGDEPTETAKFGQVVAEATGANLPDIKKEIIQLCKDLGGTKNKEMMAEIKKYVPSGNPNGLKDEKEAVELLKTLKTMKPVE